MFGANHLVKENLSLLWAKKVFVIKAFLEIMDFILDKIVFETTAILHK